MRRDHIDVRAYGAAANGSDDWAALTAAEQATQNGGRGQKLVIPFGDYYVSKPVVLMSGGKHLTVEGNQAGVNATTGLSRFIGTHAGGPVLLGCGTATPNGLVAGMVSGAGQAWTNTSNTYWFTLSDIDTVELNGLSAFTIETFYKGAGGDLRTLAGSAGHWLTSDTWNNCLRLRTLVGGGVEGFLKTSGGSQTVSGGTVNDNVLHHIALQYDGATLRLFVGGVPVGSGALTGTISQDISEQVTWGILLDRTPDGSFINQNSNGTMQSIRLSNAALYPSGGFTPPTSVLPVLSSTLIVANAESSVGTCIQAANPNGTCWLYQRANTSVIAGAGGLFLRDLAISSAVNGRTIGWMVGNESYNWGAEGLNLTGCRVGIYGPKGDLYGWSLNRIYLNGNNTGHFGIMLGSNGGFGTANEIWLQGNRVQLVMLATNSTIIGMNCEGTTRSVIGALLRNENTSASPITLQQCTFRTEAGVGSSYRTGLAFGGITLRTSGVIAQGCVWETGNNAPYLIGDTVDDAEFVGCNFVKSGSPTRVMTAQGTFTRPVRFVNCDQPNGWLPLSNVPGTAVVGKIGKLTAIAFATPLTLDCSLRDDFELAALTGAITINFSNVTPGQKISLWTVQNAGGGNAITFGTVNGTGAVKGATANDTTASHWTQYVFDMNLAGNLTQIGFNSGA